MTFEKLYQVLRESNASTISLREIYNEDFPERNDIFWDHVAERDFDVQLPIRTATRKDILHYFNNQYGTAKVSEILKMLLPEQKKTLQHYVKSPNLTGHIILVSGKDLIVDGNHRALAVVINNKSIQFVDLADLP